MDTSQLGSLKSFLQRWLICALAVAVAVYLVPGLSYDKSADLLIASLLLGVLNAGLRPLLLLLTLPLVLVTLGLFTLVINAVLLYAVGLLLRPHFVVESFGAAFWGALVISIVTLALNWLTGTGRTRVVFRHHRRPPRDDDSGPVIDV